MDLVSKSQHMHFAHDMLKTWQMATLPVILDDGSKLQSEQVLQERVARDGEKHVQRRWNIHAMSDGSQLEENCCAALSAAYTC